MNSTGVEPTQASLSIVAPCYNEEEVLPEFVRRVTDVLETLSHPYEILLVDDGSSDRTWPLIAEAAAENPRVRGIRLLRNHGHQLALSAGLHETRGDLVVAIDADLQDPPELIGDMIKKLNEDAADVVYGQRKTRAGETRFKRLTAHMFYRVLRTMTNVEIPPDTGDFRLMRRSVVDVLNAMPERHRFIRGMVAWIGGRQVPLMYDRDERFAGETKYPLRKMIRFAVDAITSFSRHPLTFANYVGMAMGLLSLILGVWSLTSYFYTDTVSGWTSVMTVFTFQFALVFFFIGMIGEYIGRIFEMSQKRPLFLLHSQVGQGLEAPHTDTHPQRQDVS